MEGDEKGQKLGRGVGEAIFANKRARAPFLLTTRIPRRRGAALLVNWPSDERKGRMSRFCSDVLPRTQAQQWEPCDEANTDEARIELSKS